MAGRRKAPAKRVAEDPPPAEVTGDGEGQALPPAPRTDRLGRPKRDRRARFN